MVNNRKKAIDRIIENRIALGQKYMSQSLPVISVNEAFDPSANILTNLANKNRDVWRIIKNEVPAVWTDIVDDMIDVYNKDEMYGAVKDIIIGGHKELIPGTEYYGLMIFTDSKDDIKCVVAGKQAGADSVYVSEDIEKLFVDRYNMMKDTRDELKDKFHIDTNNFALGTTKTDNTALTLQQFVGKILYDTAVNYSENNKNDDYISVWKDARAVYSALRDINLVYWEGRPVRFVKKSSKGTKDTNDFAFFNSAILKYASHYDFGSMLDPEFLRLVLRLANIRTSNMSKSAKDTEGNEIQIPIYKDSEICLAKEDELVEMYEQLKDVNVRNSLLFNFSPIKDINANNKLSAWGQLILVPEHLSRLYFIHNLSSTKNRRLDTIQDIGEPDYTGGELMDIEDRYNTFKSPEAVEDRRRNWEVGRLPKKPSKNKYYRWAPSTTANPHGNAGRTAEEIRHLRELRRKGMIPTSKETREEAARERRSAEWQNIDPKFNAAKYDDKHKKDLITRQENQAKTYSTLATYYNEFMTSYESFIDTTKDSFDNIINLCQYDYDGTKELRNSIFRYCVIFKAVLEAAHNEIVAGNGTESFFNRFSGVTVVSGGSKGYFTKYLEYMRLAKKMLKNQTMNSATDSLIDSMRNDARSLNNMLNNLCDSKQAAWYLDNAKKFYKAKV